MKVNEVITERIIELMEKNGEIPWKKPWASQGNVQYSLNSGKPYHGINFFLTAFAGFSSPYWLTFKQVKERNGSVKAGSKGTPIIFFTKREDEESEKSYPIMRYYTVFNVGGQTEGIDYPRPEMPIKEFTPIERAERIIAGYTGRPEVKTGGPRACYSPELDQVCMPAKEAFESEQFYYSVLFHELSHSTGHKSRLDRLEDCANFGSLDYSKEELTAELGAAFLSNEAGIVQATIENSAAYIQSWSKKLRENPGWIISASARAQKAFDWIMGKRPER